MVASPDPVLAAYRKSIDNFDAALIHILAERFRITQAVGDYKAKARLPAADPRHPLHHCPNHQTPATAIPDTLSYRPKARPSHRRL